jgi:CheY-like chemotaxis protein
MVAKIGLTLFMVESKMALQNPKRWRGSMPDDAILKGRRVLIVDDEPDVLETLEELLNQCLIDKAPSFETGVKFLRKNTYDLAIFDIMGVKGYDLLCMAREKAIPAIMLTAHALSPDNLIKSIKEGAHSYVPKDKLPEIATFVRDILEARQKGDEKPARWFFRLKPFFDKHFGTGWRNKDRDFWNDFDTQNVINKKDMEELM